MPDNKVRSLSEFLEHVRIFQKIMFLQEPSDPPNEGRPSEVDPIVRQREPIVKV